MTHVYTTAMARRYVSARGRAISIAQLGHTLSETIGPASIVALLPCLIGAHFGLDYPLLPFACSRLLYAILPSARTYKTVKELDGLTSNQSLPEIASTSQRQWRRSEVLRDPTFWLALVWLAAVPSFVLTGLLFHQIYLAEAKGVALSNGRRAMFFTGSLP